MREDDGTTDALIRALELNIAKAIREGKTNLSAELTRLDELKRKRAKERGGGEETPEDESIGLPSHVRVPRRKYTLSEKALKQRQEAAQQPRSGLENNRNAYRHGRYSKSFVTRIKPCLSTCERYPCRLVEEGATEPGSHCLDAAELLHVFDAVADAIKNPTTAEAFQEVAALNIANSVKILEMLQEDILRDGSLVRSESYKDGDLTKVEYKLHPALLALPKLVSDLGLTPEAFLITPRARARADMEDRGVTTLADLLSGVGKNLAAVKKQGDDA